MNYINKDEIKRITGKSESTIKKFIHGVKNGLIKPVDGLVSLDELTSQSVTKNKQVQTLVNEIFVKSYFNINGLNNERDKIVDTLESDYIDKVNQLNEPVNQLGGNELLINKLSNEVEYLRGLLAEKERKNDELTTQLMSTNNRLFEITETNQKLLQNQQILQQTQQTKSIEEDTQKPRKWWQFKK
jgi:hypothetical protein